jgi:hypothetical protein
VDQPAAVEVAKLDGERVSDISNNRWEDIAEIDMDRVSKKVIDRGAKNFLRKYQPPVDSLMTPSA